MGICRVGCVRLDVSASKFAIVPGLIDTQPWAKGYNAFVVENMAIGLML